MCTIDQLLQQSAWCDFTITRCVVSLHCLEKKKKTELLVFDIKSVFKCVSSMSVLYKPFRSAVTFDLFGWATANSMVRLGWYESCQSNCTAHYTTPQMWKSALVVWMNHSIFFYHSRSAGIQAPKSARTWITENFHRYNKCFFMTVYL